MPRGMVIEEPEGKFEISQGAPPRIADPFEIAIPQVNDKVAIIVLAPIFSVKRAVFLPVKNRWVFYVEVEDSSPRWITLAADGSAWIETDELASNV